MRASLAVSLGPALFALGSCAPSLFDAEKIDKDYAAPADGVLYALPKGYVSLTIERKFEADKAEKPEADKTEKPEADKTASLVVTMAEPKFVPDAIHLFFLNYLHNGLSSTNVKIDTNEKGLVTSVSTTTKDPLPAAIHELANFVVGVATQGISAGAPTKAAEADKDKPFKVEAVFDPARTPGCVPRGPSDYRCDTPALQNLKTYLTERDVELYVDRPGVIDASGDDIAIADGCRQMVCYRFVLPYHIRVVDKHSNSMSEAVVLLPNEGPVAGIRLVHRSLVENKFLLTFILTSAQYDDPSMLIGLIKYTNRHTQSNCINTVCTLQVYDHTADRFC